MAHILIVEDEELISLLYETVFTRRGYMVDLAADGEEALVKVKTLLPELMLLDVMMPKMNGVKVLETMKADMVLKDVPVVMLTNLTDPAIEQSALQLGALRYVIKSQHQPNEVVDIIDELMKTLPSRSTSQ
jgi:two-component system, OmpR family, alkaline phosphatase synthesis response regulator PhoP